MKTRVETLRLVHHHVTPLDLVHDDLKVGVMKNGHTMPCVVIKVESCHR